MRKQEVILTINLYTTTKVVLDLFVLASWLEEIDHHYVISQIKVEGADPSTLSDFYLDLLIKLCSNYTSNIIMVTSLQELNRTLINDNVTLQVYLPFNTYSQDKSGFSKVVNNIKAIGFNKVLTAFSYIDDCVGLDKDNIILLLNQLSLKSWELRHNLAQKSSIKESEQLITEYLNLKEGMNFALINDYKLNHIQPIRNYFNSIYLYINPEGSISHYFYDNEGNLSKGVYTDILDIQKDLDEENLRVSKYCVNCPFKLYCLAETINPTIMGPSCSGYKSLLQK